MAEIHGDFLEEDGAEGLAGGGDEDGEQRREEADRVDDVLVPEEDEAADDLLAEVRVQGGVVLRQDGLEVLREGPRLFEVAVGDVGDEVDDVVEGLDGLARRGRGRDEEDFLLGLILLPLLEEVVLVGSAAVST